MRVTENMTANNAIYNINKSQNKLNQLNELLSSNQNINRPSDDPIGTRQILDLQSQVSSINQYMSNISNGQTWTSVANIALQGMNDFLAQAKSTASNVLGGMNDPVSITNALATLENVRQQMIDLSNVQVGDQYVFGGFNNSTPVVANKKLSGVVDVSKPPNQISGIDTTGLIVGMTVTGKGIQPDTTITNIDSSNNIVTLSKNPISSGSGFDYTFAMPPATQKGNTSQSTTQFQITGINTAGLKVGDPVTGPGVPLDTTISSIDSAGQVTISKALTQATADGSFNFVPRIIQTAGNAVNGATTITNIDTTGFHVGGTITGQGIPSGTTVTGFTGPGPLSTVTLSQPMTQGATGTTTFSFTPTLIQRGNVDAITGLNTIKGLDTTNLSVGDTITGPGVPAVPPGIATTIQVIGPGNQITLNQALTQPVSGGIFTLTSSSNTPVGTQTGNTTPQITGLVTTGLSTGMMISGPGVPSGTTILSVDSASQISLSQPLTQTVTNGTFTFSHITPKTGGSITSLTNTITGLPDTTGLAVGMSVSGTGIPDNTKIIGIGPGTTLTLNNNATQTATGANFSFGPAFTKSGTTNPPNQITGLPLTQLQNLYIGMKVTGPGLPDNTTITDIDTTDNNGTGSITLSRVPTGPGGTGQFVFEGYIDSYGERTMMGSVTNGSSSLSALPSTTNMISAPVLSKSGSTNPSVNPNQITGLADTNGLAVGMPITDNAGGTIIPPNTIITGIDPVAKSITLSNPYIPPATKAGITDPAAIPPNQITGIIDTTNLSVGMPVTGPGIPANTTITGTPASNPLLAAGTVTLSNTPTAAAAGGIFSFAPTTLISATGVSFNFSQPISKTAATTALTNQITGLGDTNNLFVGMPVSDNAGGTIIPANTVITAIDSAAKTVTLSNNSIT
ncbi:MAG: hypothetical protein PHD54_09390, partial [Desulfuromonadaceae bacterium]|nr:hypothetical protein [Desulfuromonadaceae bacterium]